MYLRLTSQSQGGRTELYISLRYYTMFPCVLLDGRDGRDSCMQVSLSGLDMCSGSRALGASNTPSRALGARLEEAGPRMLHTQLTE